MPTHTATRPGETFAGYSELRTKACAVCGVLYAAPSALFDKRWQTGDNWYCPNGHSLVFTETAEDKIAKLERQRDQARDHRVAVQAALDQQRELTRAEKAAKTRMRNQRDRERQRTKAGVCPCCHRSFKQLARHMAGQHPDYPPAE